MLGGAPKSVEQAQKIDDDASLDDLQNLGDDLPQSDQDAGDAFGEWATDNCPMDVPSLEAPSVEGSPSS